MNRNDPAAKYLIPADDPSQAALAKITLLTLTTHTSGLPRLPQNIGLNPDTMTDPYSAYDRAKLVEALKFHGSTATVGSASYSNFGAAVLGEALAAAWGPTYARALKEHILVPLGLRETSLGISGEPVRAILLRDMRGGSSFPIGRSRPLPLRARSEAPFATWRPSCKRPWATTRAHFRPRSRRPRSRSAHLTSLAGKIGMGWLISGDSESPVIWHNGATAGSHSFIAFSAKTRSGVVILANFQKGPEGLGNELLASQGPKPSVPAVANASDYTGEFPLMAGFVIQISQEKGSLYLQATGQPRFGLRPKSGEDFAVVGVPAAITFERDGLGKVIALVLHQNGTDQRALRGVLPPAPKHADLPRATLLEYPGSYALAPTFVLTISEEAGTLYAQATGQGKAPIYPSAKDEFFYTVVKAEISFQRDSSGKVTGLVLHQAGMNMPAPRTP